MQASARDVKTWEEGVDSHAFDAEGLQQPQKTRLLAFRTNSNGTFITTREENETAQDCWSLMNVSVSWANEIYVVVEVDF